MQAGGAFLSTIQYCTWACLGPQCLCLYQAQWGGGGGGETDSLRSSPEKKEKYIKRVGSLILVSNFGDSTFA